MEQRIGITRRICLCIGFQRLFWVNHEQYKRLPNNLPSRKYIKKNTKLKIEPGSK